MAEVFAARTAGNVAVSMGGPGDHAACDTQIAHRARGWDEAARYVRELS
jgi:hypothetical protein